MKKFLVLAIALVCIAGMVYAETTVYKNSEKLENVVEMRADQFIKVCGNKDCKCENCSVDCTCEEDAGAEAYALRTDEERLAFEGRVDALLASLGKTDIQVESVKIEREPSPDVPLFIKKDIKQEYLQSYEEEEVKTEVKVEKKVAPKKTKKVTYGYSHK